MKRKHSAAALALLLTLLAACGGKTAETLAPTPQVKETLPLETPTEPPEPVDNSIRVKSVPELLEAIETGADIALEKGKYNLTDYLGSLSESQVEEWNRSHESVELRKCFDGLEVVIRDVVELSIHGTTYDSADTWLLTDPRNADVLAFEDCSSLTLANLTLGHTDLGTCHGDVLSFQTCQSVGLYNLDLFGCGVCAINAENGSGDFFVNRCTLRDCEWGSFNVEGAKGEFIFQDCVLTGSPTGGFFVNTRDTQLSFYGCSFGQGESNTWYFRDDIFADEKCNWTEPDFYPDMEPDFYPDIEPGMGEGF